MPVRDFKQAKQWDSIMKARAVLNNSVSKSIRSGYAVQLIDTEEIVEKKELEKKVEEKSNSVFRNIEDDNIHDWLSKINIIRDVLSGSEGRSAELSDKISEIDKEIIDIQHYYV